MEYSDQIKKNIKSLAKIRGIKLKDLEEKVGLAEGFLSRKHTGLKIDICKTVSDILGVKVDELLDNDFEQEYLKRTAKLNLQNSLIKAQEVLTGVEIWEVVNHLLCGKKERRGREEVIRGEWIKESWEPAVEDRREVRDDVDREAFR